MNATVCPSCNGLLTAHERARENCPKCKKSLPPVESRTSLSDRRPISRKEITNDKQFCLKMSLSCIALGILAVLAACGLIQFESGGSTAISIAMTVGVIAILIVSAVAGYFGLSGGLKNGFAESITVSAIGLILSGGQLVFWFVSLGSLVT